MFMENKQKCIKFVKVRTMLFQARTPQKVPLQPVYEALA